MKVKCILNQCSVVLTRDCNLRCNFCYVKDAGYSKNEMISLNNLKKVVDFCCSAKMKYIFFTGGEPVTYPYLNDILIYIKQQKHKMTTAIASNGVLLGNYELCKQLIDNGLDYVDISMKGKNSQEWIDITGCDGYEKQLQAIKNLSALSMDYTCSMVLTHDNIFSMCDSVKSAVDNGAKQFSFTFVIDNDDYQNKNIPYLERRDPLKLIDSFISQVSKLDEITQDWWIEYSFPMCVYSEKQLEVLQGKMASPCQIHKRNSVTFDTEMNLLPCDMYFNNKIGRLGKDFNNLEDFLKLRERNTYKDIIDQITQVPSEKCVQCQYFEKCYGGCPVLWKNYTFEELERYKGKMLN